MDRSCRLRKGREFDTVFREGTVLHSPFFVVRCRPNELDRSRWAFAVGKRLAPRAHDRNWTKRRIREAARGLDVVGGWDVLLVAKQPALAGSVVVMRDALARVLRSRGILSR